MCSIAVTVALLLFAAFSDCEPHAPGEHHTLVQAITARALLVIRRALIIGGQSASVGPAAKAQTFVDDTTPAHVEIGPRSIRLGVHQALLALICISGFINC